MTGDGSAVNVAARRDRNQATERGILMGMMIEGRWHDQWYSTKESLGRFVRSESQFRSWVTPDGAPGPSGVGGFKAEPGRYHLYVSLACPWAHRALIFRSIKGLEDLISVSVTHWFMGKDGWTFADGPGVVADPVTGARYLWEVYAAAAPDYSGRVTVPVLWDKKTGTIVSNESSEIIRMFNSAFDDVGACDGDYYPAALRPEIDTLNARRSDYLVMVAPIAGVKAKLFASREPAAMVIIQDPRRPPVPIALALSDLYGLTPAEAGLAAKLSTGATLDEIAQHRNVKISTLRTQLSVVLAKTGTTRQAQLLSLLAKLQILS
jgi:DNA-binding CsgD family transcriptional regulator